ncbi:MAG: acylneuraminate cytidylyltransferase family protein, partial [Deltaproteobacteria bacterium]|nr:acylneuraminate cytidylyltransferase family protein [Deltaproteobacteria bacterium]
YLVPYMQEHGFGKRSQDLPSALVVNGSIYLISPENLRSQRTFVGAKTRPLIIESPEEVLDIDTEWDWRLAEFVLCHQKNQSA